MILEQEVFVSGLVDESGDLLICFQETTGKGIKLLPVIFNDNESGVIIYDMPNLLWDVIIYLPGIMHS